MSNRILLIIFFLLAAISSSEGNIIANKKITNRDFGVWRVSCEEDEMFEHIRCVIFVGVSENTTIFVNPYNRSPVIVVSKDCYPEKSIFVKVDANKPVISKPMRDAKYGLISFREEDAKKLFGQIKSGNHFYMRVFMKKPTSPEGFEEITIKFPLLEFQRAFTYYEEQVNKYYVNNL
ncbi:MAG: hypothetical protein LBI70_03000 [Rickettsiales bacterium]|jgi:hypothetical protein|nr:hypothetical protein [Rickettsiales bacterium]